LNTNNYSGIRDAIYQAENIIISTHANPDGDTLGSALGLYHFLISKKLNAQLICPDVAPNFLSWMPAYDKFITYQKSPTKLQAIISQADLIIHIDYNAFHRTGEKVSPLLANIKGIQHVMIDHHPNPEDGFSAYVSDPTACSTAQLVYQFTQYIEPDMLLPINSATCLYVGLITDTGSFSYGMADEKPYLVAAALVQAGINDRLIHEKVYSNNTLNRLKLLGYALSEKLIINKDEKWAYISLNRQELEKYDYQAGDTEGIVNYALSVFGVNAAILLTEKDGKIRLSFRSKANFAVNKIARDYFGGGGHLNAAGGNSTLSMEATIEDLKIRMTEFKKELQNTDLS